MDTKVIALYFPQFHRTKENDLWWGEGFTDWTNVKQGQPLFKGHRQPRVPLDGDYYDLSDVNVIRRQAELARRYGIHGFAIYHYWFDDHVQILETPKELILKHKEIDIPFCLTWANETWSRRWEGKDREVLLQQTHTPSKEKWKTHFEYLLPYFQDSRAIRIDGKILFQIYRPHLIDKVDQMLAYWRELAREAGIGELYFMAIKSFDFPDNRVLDGFDGVLLFQPHAATNSPKGKGFVVHVENLLRHLPETWLERLRTLRTRNRNGCKIYQYQKIWDIIHRDTFRYKDKDVFQMGFLGWDNTARYRNKATVYDGCTPDIFESNFRKIYEKASKQPENKRFVFINAWNEWAEGTYLEPDTDHGYGYLEAIQRIIKKEGKL